MAWANDYVDVATRLQLFYELYPDGVIQCMPAEIKLIGDKQFIAVMAHGYKRPDDLMPFIAQAWEPAVGATNFTRNSEAMNAETSAVGRMLGVMGIAAKKSIASRDEIANRSGEPETVPDNKAFTGLIHAISQAITLQELEVTANIIKETELSPAHIGALRDAYTIRKNEVES